MKKLKLSGLAPRKGHPNFCAQSDKNLKWADGKVRALGVWF